eukprot:Sdes_comp15598_c0_seq1m4584
MFLEADARKKGYITKEDIDRILTCKFRHKKHRNTWLTVLASFFSIHPQNQEPHSADFFHANMNCFYLDSSPQTNSKPKFASKNPNHARLRKKNIFLPKNCSPNHTKLKKIQYSCSINGWYPFSSLSDLFFPLFFASQGNITRRKIAIPE